MTNAGTTISTKASVDDPVFKITILKYLRKLVYYLLYPLSFHEILRNNNLLFLSS